MNNISLSSALLRKALTFIQNSKEEYLLEQFQIRQQLADFGADFSVTANMLFKQREGILREQTLFDLVC